MYFIPDVCRLYHGHGQCCWWTVQHLVAVMALVQSRSTASRWRRSGGNMSVRARVQGKAQRNRHTTIWASRIALHWPNTVTKYFNIFFYISGRRLGLTRNNWLERWSVQLTFIVLLYRGAITAEKLRKTKVWVLTPGRLRPAPNRRPGWVLGRPLPLGGSGEYHPGKFLKTQMLNPTFWWLIGVKFLAFWKLRP